MPPGRAGSADHKSKYDPRSQPSRRFIEIGEEALRAQLSLRLPRRHRSGRPKYRKLSQVSYPVSGD